MRTKGTDISIHIIEVRTVQGCSLRANNVLEGSFDFTRGGEFFFSFFWKQGIHSNQSQWYVKDPCHSANINDEWCRTFCLSTGGPLMLNKILLKQCLLYSNSVHYSPTVRGIVMSSPTCDLLHLLHVFRNACSRFNLSDREKWSIKHRRLQLLIPNVDIM